MSDKIINLDYIGVLRDTPEGLKQEEIAIEKNEKLLADLKQLSEEEADCLTIQERFREDFPVDRWGISYLYPYGYDSSFLDVKSFPKVEKDKYEQWLLDKRKELCENTCSRRCEHYSAAVEGDWDGCPTGCEDKQYITRQYEKSIKNRGRSFYDWAIDYLNAYFYSEQAKKINEDPSIRMRSSEGGGWMAYNYKVSDDIVCDLQTNFGYGYSSYFYESVSYKGVRLVPYTAFVEYYWARAVDLMKYTWRYNLNRASWRVAFRNTEEITNQAKQDPDRFVNTWVSDQVRRTIAKLKEIDTAAERILKDFTEKRPDAECYCYVRNMSSAEKHSCELYPEQMVFLLRAQKISGGLVIAEDMKRFAGMCDAINEGIAEIISLNKHLYPELCREIDVTEAKLATLKDKRDGVKAIWDKAEELYQAWNGSTAPISGIWADLLRQLGHNPTHEDISRLTQADIDPFIAMIGHAQALFAFYKENGLYDAGHVSANITTADFARAYEQGTELVRIHDEVTARLKNEHEEWDAEYRRVGQYRDCLTACREDMKPFVEQES